MALSSALYTGLSGLSVNQTRLQVIGNNIANVNSVAFKASRALFKPQFYTTDRGGTAPTDTFGGTNPSQRGLGAQVAVIEKNYAQGNLETTGRTSDMAIDGEGFFVVRGTETQYTRDGSFLLTEDRKLVTQGGQFVQGYLADEDGVVQPGALADITVPIGELTSAQPTENALLKGNLNANGPLATGASVLRSAGFTDAGGAAAGAGTALVDLREPGDTATALFAAGQALSVRPERGGATLPESTFTVDAASTLDDLRAFLQGALAIDPSVPGPAGTPYETPGVALVPAAGGGTALSIVGNVGTANALALNGNMVSLAGGTSPLTFDDTADSAPLGEGVQASQQVYDSLGTPLDLRVGLTLESKSDLGTVWRWQATSADNVDGTSTPNAVVGGGTVSFDTEGRFVESSASTVEIQRVGTGAGSPLAVRLDFGALTALTDAASNAFVEVQDGMATGTLVDYSVGADGSITGAFSNGLTRTLGQLAVAQFDNAMGLVDDGENLLSQSASSGVPFVTTPGRLGAGAVRSGTLEMSNVDLSREFIDMITTTSGYTAASRVITTSDRLLQELMNVSR